MSKTETGKFDLIIVTCSQPIEAAPPTVAAALRGTAAESDSERNSESESQHLAFE